MFNLSRWRRTEHELCQESLSAFLDGELTPRERSRVQGHLEECSACRADLESLRRTVSLLRAAPVIRPPRSFVLPAAEGARQKHVLRRRLSYAYLQGATAVATVLLVLVVSGDVLLYGQVAAPAMRSGGDQTLDMVTTELAKSAVDEGEDAWVAPAASQEPTELPADAPLVEHPLVDAPAPASEPAEPADRASTEGIVPEALPMPSRTFATSAGAPPVIPTLTEAKSANQLHAASPTAMASDTPTPYSTPTLVPPQPTAYAEPVQLEEVSAGEGPDVPSLPSGPLGWLHGWRSFVPWIEGSLAVVIAVLVGTMLWLRRGSQGVRTD